jgi:subtilisin family serine protease
MPTKKKQKQKPVVESHELTLEMEQEIETNLDPHLQDIILATEAGEAPDPALAMTADGDVIVDVIAKLKDPAQPVPGLNVVRTNGLLVTGTVSVSQIENVRNHANVVSLKRADKVYSSLRTSVPEIHAASAQLRDGLPGLAQPIDGAGVIVGVVDFGCDFAHPNFRHADGSTRLLHLWDQNGIRTAISPIDFGYGREFSAAMINQALQSADPYATLAYDPDVIARPPAHGTHVMDIAAGNGRAPNSSPGVAPKADLIFVQLAAVDVSSDESFGNSRRLLEAVDYIFTRAGALNKAAVVNLSLGTHGGPHDGSTLAEQWFDGLLTVPGRAIVISAGNSFERASHASGEIAVAGTHILHWNIGANDPTDNELEVWYKGPDILEVTLISPNGQSFGPVRQAVTATIRQQGQLRGRIIHRRRDPNNSDNQIDILLNRTLPSGVWQVVLRNVGGQPARFHSWIERDDRGQGSFAAQDDDRTHTLGSISCGQQTMVVGSYDARVPGKDISFFSSAGPTRDGRQKPEVSAPGHEIIAARSRTQGTTRMSGTSMAAPHVTGLAALLLQAAGPTLSVADLRALLINHARPATTTGWDARLGNGRVDGLAALQGQLGLTPAPLAPTATVVGDPSLAQSDGSSVLDHWLAQVAEVAARLHARIRMQIEVEPMAHS